MISGSNGCFFELTNNILYVCIRYSKSNPSSLINFDIKIPQCESNNDRLDGCGPSKIKLTRYNQLFLFKIEFDMVNFGSIRYYIYINNIPIFLHEFLLHQNRDIPFKSNLLPLDMKL